MLTTPKKPRGFTIIELLIVIVIIAILAAITLVVYSSIQDRARQSTAQSDFENFYKKAELFRIDSPTSAYPTSPADLTAAGVTFTKSVYDGVILCFSSTTPIWALVVDLKDGKSYYYTNTDQKFSEFTANKVVGASGGVTCPEVGSSYRNWQWLYQGTAIPWQI